MNPKAPSITAFITRHGLDPIQSDRLFTALSEPGEWDLRHRISSPRKPLLVGEAPGKNGRNDCPLFPVPERASGARLQALLGLDMRTYLRAFERADLLSYYPGSSWNKGDEKAAMAAAGALMNVSNGRIIFPFGRKAGAAFGHDGDWFSSCPHPKFRCLTILLPHPSGRNRVWKDETMKTRLLETVKEACPWIFEPVKTVDSGHADMA